MQRTYSFSTIAIATIFSLTACEGSDDDSSLQHAGLLSETVVSAAPDGSHSVTVHWLTVEQMASLKAAKLSAAAANSGGGEYVYNIVQDGNCDTKSIWIFDQPNATGNVICFDNRGAAPQASGGVDLRDYGWSQRVRSYWPGDLDGFFYNFDTFSQESWSAWGPLTNADATVQEATAIFIYGYSTCPSGGC
jgi:hypothetical protein